MIDTPLVLDPDAVKNKYCSSGEEKFSTTMSGQHSFLFFFLFFQAFAIITIQKIRREFTDVQSLPPLHAELNTEIFSPCIAECCVQNMTARWQRDAIILTRSRRRRRTGYKQLSEVNHEKSTFRGNGRLSIGTNKAFAPSCSYRSCWRWGLKSSVAALKRFTTRCHQISQSGPQTWQYLSIKCGFKKTFYPHTCRVWIIIKKYHFIWQASELFFFFSSGRFLLTGVWGDSSGWLSWKKHMKTTHFPLDPAQISAWMCVIKADDKSSDFNRVLTSGDWKLCTYIDNSLDFLADDLL